MPISFDGTLGVHEQAIKVRSHRAAVLANNLANADTPGFKAKDVDFKAVLNGQVQLNQSRTDMARTHDKHIGNAQVSSEYDTLYRIPHQPSVDGNTVEEQVEHAEYMKNNLAFQASFTMLNSKFKGLVSALRGE